MARTGLRVLAAAALAALVACGSGPKYPPYSPHETLLSVAAEFSLLNGQDPYRDEMARDLTGQGIANATLVRLANYEALHPNRFRPELQMLRGRALEWAGELGEALEAYRSVGGATLELSDEATRRITLLSELEAIATGAPVASLERRLRALEDQERALLEYAGRVPDPFYASLGTREAERVAVERVEFLAANTAAIPGGEDLAIGAMERMLEDYQLSSRAMEHALRLARFHRSLAELELRLHPPPSTRLDLDRFKVNYQRALDLLHRVSQADGRPERVVAKHELDALLAVGEMVQDRY